MNNEKLNTWNFHKNKWNKIGISIAKNETDNLTKNDIYEMRIDGVDKYDTQYKLAYVIYVDKEKYETLKSTFELYDKRYDLYSHPDGKKLKKGDILIFDDKQGVMKIIESWFVTEK